jgi:predicted aspartyl protease
MLSYTGVPLKLEHATARVKLSCGGKTIEVEALVDTGASKSIVSKGLAERLEALIPLKEPYEIRTADEEGRLRIVGRCMVDVEFQGVRVPGGAVFEVAENLGKGVDLIIGRPEIDSWGIVFTPEGPKPRRVPLEFEIV